MSDTSSLSDAPPVSPSFQALMETFASLSGVAAVQDSLGLELQAGPHTARVMPDAVHPEQLVIEVDVGPAADAPAAALALLHRINHMARFRHGWWVSLDMDDHIVMHTTRALARTDAGALETLLTDGLERAVALNGMWQACLTGPSEDTPQALPAWGLASVRA